MSIMWTHLEAVYQAIFGESIRSIPRYPWGTVLMSIVRAARPDLPKSRSLWMGALHYSQFPDTDTSYSRWPRTGTSSAPGSFVGICAMLPVRGSYKSSRATNHLGLELQISNVSSLLYLSRSEYNTRSVYLCSPRPCKLYKTEFINYHFI